VDGELVDRELVDGTRYPNIADHGLIGDAIDVDYQLDHRRGECRRALRRAVMGSAAQERKRQ
jgi:hypothetical protein